MGKSGFIAQKLSATFASTGTPSLYLHPAEALHGDLGRVVKEDVLLALSNSGATDELLQLLPSVRRLGVKVVALTGDVRSPLAQRADVVLDIGPVDEACPMGLAPTASTLALLGLGDALAMTVLNRAFGSEEYARLHPGGSLGQSVRRVDEVMRQGESNPVISETEPLSRAVAVMTRTAGRPGATSVVNRAGKLVGIFTDGGGRSAAPGRGRKDRLHPRGGPGLRPQSEDGAPRPAGARSRGAAARGEGGPTPGGRRARGAGGTARHSGSAGGARRLTTGLWVGGYQRGDGDFSDRHSRRRGGRMWCASTARRSRWETQSHPGP